MEVELVLLVLLVDEVEPRLKLRTKISRFSFLLVDVELVVDVVPIKKYAQL